MADHFSGPRAIADPAADIADMYVFPSPERPGNLALVLNVFPAAAPGAFFSDVISYQFRIRPVTIASIGKTFNVADDEYAVSCTFKAPGKGDSGEALVQTGTCTTPTGKRVAVRVGDAEGTEADGLRVFAGLRLDPFFIDLIGVQATEKVRRLAFKPQADNVLQGTNILSIVVEGEPTALFGEPVGPLLGFVAETVTLGRPSIRIERFGRPEVKNVVMSAKTFDTVNRDLEIRDLFNQEDAFHLSKDYLGAYRARLNANLAFFDALDGKNDWPLDADGNHPLTALLLADFMIVDVSKPFSEDSCFEIERSLLHDRASQTCGGRWLNDDIVDGLYTLLVNGGDGPRIRDGVDQATIPAGQAFPYLVAPNSAPPNLRARMAQGVPSSKSGSPT